MNSIVTKKSGIANLLFRPFLTVFFLFTFVLGVQGQPADPWAAYPAANPSVAYGTMPPPVFGSPTVPGQPAYAPLSTSPPNIAAMPSNGCYPPLYGNTPPRLVYNDPASPLVAMKPGANEIDPSRRKLYVPDKVPPKTPTCFESTCYMLKDAKNRIFTDYRNLYNCNNALNFSVALMGAAVLANTSMDRHFQNWYGEHVQCNFTDEFSEFSKIFGEGKYFIPITVTSAVLYRYWQERTGNKTTRRPGGDFFARTARGYSVGAPALVIGQSVLGADRPRDGSSYWKPFQQNHGISGHAFIGAVPFITAAQMSDGPVLKGMFYTLSILPAWSRVNDDAHYLSQVVLGWYLAYLSVRAVSETEGLKPLPKGLTIFPVTEGNGIGIGLLYRR